MSNFPLSEIPITLSQLNKMRHCIGLDDLRCSPQYKNSAIPVFRSFRNRYITGECGDADLDKLCLYGVIERTVTKNGKKMITVYSITLLGKQFLEELLNIKIEEVD